MFTSVALTVQPGHYQGPHFHNYRDHYGNTMVMIAISSNSRHEILEFLLEVSSNVALPLAYAYYICM